MKKLPLVIALFVSLYIGWGYFTPPNDSTGPAHQSDRILASAFEKQKSGFQAEGAGIVVKILPDDNIGGHHQRLILRLHSGQTLLIAHNTDLAPRLSSIKKGDALAFNGEYEWNSKGGVIHWTHHDPNGRHVTGWLKHNGQTYQ
jgi:hypothetical protein